MEITGKVKVINPEQQVSASFKKRELVVTTEEQYAQHIMIEFTQDKCDLLNNYKPDELVKVSINLRGREWINAQGETKYFNSIQGWRIERLAANQQAAAPAQNNSAVDEYQNRAQTETNPQQVGNAEDHDDLPF